MQGEWQHSPVRGKVPVVGDGVTMKEDGQITGCEWLEFRGVVVHCTELKVVVQGD